MLRPTDRPEPYTELAIGERSMPHRLRRFLSPTIPLVSVTIESVEAASPETMACFRIRWFCVPELTISTFSSLDTGQDRGSISGHRAVGGSALPARPTEWAPCPAHLCATILCRLRTHLPRTGSDVAGLA